jgi:hypothetical protein
MIDPLTSSTLSTVMTTERTPHEAVEAQVSYKPQEVVTISEEAQQKFKASLKNSAMVQASNVGKEPIVQNGSSWKLSNGLKDGEYILKNGNKQVVSIKDDLLEIEEFKNGKLVKTVSGSITDTGAILDTEYYDESGRVSQSIHTEIQAGDGSEKGWSLATMNRSVKWFESGNLKGEMQDGMRLDSWNNRAAEADAEATVQSMLGTATTAVASDVDEMSKKLTTEKHITQYYANFSEYGDNGKLARSIVLEQEARYTHNSNRANKKLGGMEKRTTVEAKHHTNLLLEIKDYDSEGKLVRDSRFTDTQADDAATKDNMQRQTMNVSWFSDGELIKQSSGEMTQGETANARLNKRPGFLESFGLSTEEYLGQDDMPETAMELMNKKLMDSSGKADFFSKAISEHVSDNDYSSAEGVAQYGTSGKPYSISWTDRLYKEGDLVVEQTDTEEASESSFWQQERGELFRKGAGLTENAAPMVLRRSSHEHEAFVDGKTTAHQSFEARESVEVDHDGPDRLMTDASYNQGVGMDEVTTVVKHEGGLGALDTMAHAAANGLSSEMEQTLGALYKTVNSLNGEAEVDKGTGYRIRFDYETAS